MGHRDEIEGKRCWRFVNYVREEEGRSLKVKVGVARRDSRATLSLHHHSISPSHQKPNRVTSEASLLTSQAYAH
jgi:hypothetical protein